MAKQLSPEEKSKLTQGRREGRKGGFYTSRGEFVPYFSAREVLNQRLEAKRQEVLAQLETTTDPNVRRGLKFTLERLGMAINTKSGDRSQRAAEVRARLDEVTGESRAGELTRASTSEGVQQSRLAGSVQPPAPSQAAITGREGFASRVSGSIPASSVVSVPSRPPSSQGPVQPLSPQLPFGQFDARFAQPSQVSEGGAVRRQPTFTAPGVEGAEVLQPRIVGTMRPVSPVQPLKATDPQPSPGVIARGAKFLFGIDIPSRELEESSPFENAGELPAVKARRAATLLFEQGKGVPSRTEFGKEEVVVDGQRFLRDVPSREESFDEATDRMLAERKKIIKTSPQSEALFRQQRENQKRSIESIKSKIKELEELKEQKEDSNTKAEPQVPSKVPRVMNFGFVSSDVLSAHQKDQKRLNNLNLSFLQRAELGIRKEVQLPLAERPEEIIGPAILATAAIGIITTTAPVTIPALTIAGAGLGSFNLGTRAAIVTKEVQQGKDITQSIAGQLPGATLDTLAILGATTTLPKTKTTKVEIPKIKQVSLSRSQSEIITTPLNADISSVELSQRNLAKVESEVTQKSFFGLFKKKTQFQDVVEVQQTGRGLTTQEKTVLQSQIKIGKPEPNYASLVDDAFAQKSIPRMKGPSKTELIGEQAVMIKKEPITQKNMLISETKVSQELAQGGALTTKETGFGIVKSSEDGKAQIIKLSQTNEKTVSKKEPTFTKEEALDIFRIEPQKPFSAASVIESQRVAEIQGARNILVTVEEPTLFGKKIPMPEKPLTPLKNREEIELELREPSIITTFVGTEKRTDFEKPLTFKPEIKIERPALPPIRKKEQKLFSKKELDELLYKPAKNAKPEKDINSQKGLVLEQVSKKENLAAELEATSRLSEAQVKGIATRHVEKTRARFEKPTPNPMLQKVLARTFIPGSASILVGGITPKSSTQEKLEVLSVQSRRNDKIIDSFKDAQEPRTVPILKQVPEVIKQKIVPEQVIKPRTIPEITKTPPPTPFTPTPPPPTTPPPVFRIPGLPEFGGGQRKGLPSRGGLPEKAFLPSLGVITGLLKGIKPTSKTLTGFEQRGLTGFEQRGFARIKVGKKISKRPVLPGAKQTFFKKPLIQKLRKAVYDLKPSKKNKPFKITF